MLRFHSSVYGWFLFVVLLIVQTPVLRFRFGLTTQAQRLGAREATMATATLPPGSLQRMVRPRSRENHRSTSMPTRRLLSSKSK
jgi:hypothetical protein